MLRAILFRRLTNIGKYSSCRLLSLSAVNSEQNNDDNPNSKVGVSDLLKSMEKPSKEPKETLQDLMKNMRKNATKSKGQIQRKNTKKLDEKKHEQGKQFWFKKTKTEKEEITAKEVEIFKESIISSSIEKINEKPIDKQIMTVESSPVSDLEPSIPTNKPLKVEQLKEDIRERADNRSVSKLMNALITEIDDSLPNPEEKLKSLMAAMGKSKIEEIDLSEEESQSIHSKLRDRRDRKQRFSLTYGITTNLFSDSIDSLSIHDNTSHGSLYEKQWFQDLNNLLPENVPQNSFEEIMLNIDRQWEFPINNEQNLGIEEETSFEEHVFLDYLLDEFPQTEPIQKFMELVITGLQKNPYLPVDEKKSRVLWFKSYFEKFPEEELSL